MKPPYPYSAVHERGDFSWPGGKRLALYVALNVEQYKYGDGILEQLVPGSDRPDVLNYGWCDYGTRVGVWRLLDLMEEFRMPVTLLVNSDLYEACPAVVSAFRKRGDEIACHGRTNSERQSHMPGDEESKLVEEATRALEKGEGKPPAGWLSPWISQSNATLDLLKAAGYQYVLDWCSDDQPFWLSTRGGPLLAVPYPQELNDSSTIIGRFVSAANFAEMIIDNFEEMLRQSAGQPLVMGLALHAFRLPHVRRTLAHLHARRSEYWLTHAGAIAECAATRVPIPGA